ncbi:hypothetical protein K663_18006 [Sphingobium sp. MI1205]|nr:hypothetical protein K663_18006 [Sphingobium sp. MI1205]
MAIWAGPIGLILFGSSYGPFAANFLPPPSPGWTVEQVAEHYRHYANGVRLGAIFMLLGAAALCVFAGAIAAETKRIKGTTAQAYGQIGTAALTSATLIIGAILWAVAALRPDRSAEDIALLHDIAWLFMVMPAGPGFFQLLSIGTAILVDDSPDPALPRWLAYLNFWTALLFLPGFLVAYFLSGPFAWNGLLAFWMVAVVFTLWIVVMTVSLLKAVKRW